MTLIGLTGYAGSGKDTVAEILVREHGFKRYAFADKLRELAYALNPHVQETEELYGSDLQTLVDLYGWDWTKRAYPAVREMLQRVGVWHRENVSPDFWVNLVHDQISADWHHENVVITDVRFENESDYVRRNCGHVIRVMRPGVGPVNDHESERLAFVPDFQVLNDTDKQTLGDRVGDIVWLHGLEGAA